MCFRFLSPFRTKTKGIININDYMKYKKQQPDIWYSLFIKT